MPNTEASIFRRWTPVMELLRFYRPKSFLKLILIGFAFVALPLSFALVNAAVYVGRLAEQNQRAVYQAVRATQSSQMLIEEITAMERNARQFQVLGDQALLQVYKENREELRNTAKQLSELPLDDSQRQQLNRLVEKEKPLFATLRGKSRDAGAAKQTAADFAELATLAHAILVGSNRLVDREVETMEKTAGKAQQVLVWQAFALIPGTVIFAGFFIIVIARPIRQLDEAIHRLGDGQFASEIRVTGPQDLEYLGKRLDWLRLRLIDVEEDKTKFLRHVSHELKTPLTAIREGSELLSEHVVGALNGEQEEIVKILRQNGIHLQKLIEDLLNFSVAHLRSSSLENRPVNLSELMESVLADHKPAMKAKGLMWEAELPSVTVSGDVEKLRVVIDNLLSNAVKFSPRRGVINVSLKRDAQFAVLDVADSGPGIEAAAQGRVFDAFYQGAAVQEGHLKGTGLGLSIAKEYVVAHKGRIEVVDGPEHGAHFRVTLPIAGAAAV
jgi:two-component system, NtrC family, sensor histidine kinase GlrK